MTGNSGFNFSPKLHRVQWITLHLSLEIKRPEHEADHMSLSIAEVCVELYFHYTIRLHDVVLNDRFIFMGTGKGKGSQESALPEFLKIYI
jgi:hypothetical protein